MTALTPTDANGWMPIDAALDQSAAPWDGVPVLIYTNHSWGGETNCIHRAIWTDQIHGAGIFGWAVQDLKFGPYPLRGYTVVSHWQPLPKPPVSPFAARPVPHTTTPSSESPEGEAQSLSGTNSSEAA
jgi:hypothetical protein